MKRSGIALSWVLPTLVVGAILACFDLVGFTLRGWLAYTLLLSISLLMIYFAWIYFRREGAGKALLVAALVALGLRVLVGVVLYRGLPVWGYDEKPQRAGYVFWDSYKRDTDAWSRSGMDQALTTAFTDPTGSDQYGGLLFLSSSIYRYLSPDTQRPLLIVVMTAAVSALAVLFAWGFVASAIGEKAAMIGAWILALYPEAVLLGASQMREPFLIAALAAALYGYSRIRKGELKGGITIVVASALILALPISPPFVIVIFAIVATAWFWEGLGMGRRRKLLVLALLGAVVLAALALAVRAWAGLDAIAGSPWEIIREWWANAGDQWRITLVSEQSVMLDTLLDRLPSSFRIPFLVIYGLIQPFLPAAMIAPGVPIWRSIGIWRGLGWFLTLPFLFYGTWMAFRRKGWRSLESYLAVLIWLSALVSSYRAPGYQWDNPRYRAIFLAAQVGLISWTWVEVRLIKSPWLKRWFLILSVDYLFVTYWYIGRYYSIPTLSLEAILGSILFFTVISLAGMLLSDVIRTKRLRG
ncbi:MAG: hypothetical protein MUP44_05340 [Anaerolineales bacterium]|nr:hypothetical protein [Anaerolineales bacterium]